MIVVGLNDDRTPSGLAITDHLLRQLNGIRDEGSIVPFPTLLAEKRSCNGNDIAVLLVRPSDSPPVRYKGAVHVRIGPRRSIATAQEEKILNERGRSGNRPFDIYPIPDTGISDLDQQRFEDEYLPRAVDRATLEANDPSFSEQLVATKMLESTDDKRTTVLGLLMLGRRPRDFIPGARVQFLRIAGQNLTDDIVDEATIGGTISDTLRRLEKKIDAHNSRYIDSVVSGHESRTEAYPREALRQLVCNAIMHRTYENTNTPVRMYWFDDRIEIRNPGGLFGVVTEQDLGQFGITDYRNPNLAEAMKVLGHAQGFGPGIHTARRLLSEAGHPEIEFKPDPTYMLVTVKGHPDFSQVPQ